MASAESGSSHVARLGECFVLFTICDLL